MTGVFRKRGYTLIEILIVLSIITILTGFFLSGFLKSKQKAKITKVHILMDSIAAAMRMYQDDFGSYPPTGATIYGGYVCSAPQHCLYYYLGATFRAGTNASVFAGPYLKFKGNEVHSISSSACSFDGGSATDDDMKEMIDPWGNAFRYIYPPSENQNTYDLYSLGPNGINENGAGDDVNNWE